MNAEPAKAGRRRLRWWPAVVAYVVTSAFRSSAGGAWVPWVFGGELWSFGSLSVRAPGIPTIAAAVAVFVLTNRRRADAAAPTVDL